MLYPEMVQSLTNIDGFFHSRRELDAVVENSRYEMERNLAQYKSNKPDFIRIDCGYF